MSTLKANKKSSTSKNPDAIIGRRIEPPLTIKGIDRKVDSISAENTRRIISETKKDIGKRNMPSDVFKKRQASRVDSTNDAINKANYLLKFRKELNYELPENKRTEYKQKPFNKPQALANKKSK